MTELANEIGIRIHSPSWRRLARSARRPRGHDELRRTIPNSRWSRAELLIGISASGPLPANLGGTAASSTAGEPVVKHEGCTSSLVGRRVLISRQCRGLSLALGRRRRCDRLGVDRVELGLGDGAAVDHLLGLLDLGRGTARGWRSGARSRRTAPARRTLRCRCAQPARRRRRSDRQARPEWQHDHENDTGGLAPARDVVTPERSMSTVMAIQMKMTRAKKVRIVQKMFEEWVAGCSDDRHRRLLGVFGPGGGSGSSRHVSGIFDALGIRQSRHASMTQTG